MELEDGVIQDIETGLGDIMIGMMEDGEIGTTGTIGDTDIWILGMLTLF